MVVKAAKKSASTDELTVPELDLKRLRLRVIGTAPYVTHAWSEKAKKLMREAQSGQPQQGNKKKEGRKPDEEYWASIYWTEDNKPGIPARSFKACAVDAANDVGLQKTKMKSAFHVLGDILPLVDYSEPEMREDPVRLESGVASLAYRAMFKKWAVDVHIVYNAGVITPSHLINLFRTAGFGIGVGEGRPKAPKSCGMGWGTFDVDQSQSVEVEPYVPVHLG
jgi:hypothetical protein